MIKRPELTSRIRQERTMLLFALIGATILAFIIIPIANMIATQVILDVDALIKTAKDLSILKSIWLSIYAAFLATLVALVFGVPLAYVLARMDFLGKGFVESIIDVPIVVPHTVAGIALLTVFGSHGLIGSPLSDYVRFVDALPGIVVAMLFVSVPFLINSAREGFESVDPRFESIARSLGASRWRAFREVTVPLASRHILIGAIMSWARAISEFGAIVIIAYYPMVAPTLIYERFLSEGLSASRPIAVLLMIVCLTVFILSRAVSARWRRYDRD